jgi:hypothetical protein
MASSSAAAFMEEWGSEAYQGNLLHQYKHDHEGSWIMDDYSFIPLFLVIE